MALGEDYLKLLVHIGNFTKEVTGISIVDAYFGPKELSPEKMKQVLPSEKLLANLEKCLTEPKK